MCCVFRGRYDVSNARSRDNDILSLCRNDDQEQSPRLITLCAQVRSEHAIPFHVAVGVQAVHRLVMDAELAAQHVWDTCCVPLLLVTVLWILYLKRRELPLAHVERAPSIMVVPYSPREGSTVGTPHMWHNERVIKLKDI